MKACPSCQRVYENDTQAFCLEDGTPLVNAPAQSFDSGATMKIPAGRLTNQDQTEVLTGNAAERAQPAPPLVPTQRYAAQTPSAQPQRKQSALPWLLGAAAILGLSAIAVALILTRGSGPETAQTTQNISQSDNGNTAQSESMNSNSAQGDVSTDLPANSPVTNLSTPASVTTSNVSRATEEPTPRAAPAEVPKPTPDELPPPSRPTPKPVSSGPISGGVLNGKAISLPRPAYPPIAKAAHASGVVTVQVTIDESGKVISARAISGHPLLQQSAVQAAYGARFTPTQLSGQPVKVMGVITYNFVAQ